ncbi:prephenate dehydrogenase [Marivirga sp.]|uniref:prephenate dehydrogenase n=1 Tax=Marivirga sp. TaxID=2018662 RepID=UPI002D7E84D1|nr:prephenate dehydrogenase [Marivirga sp.]HET8859678.1 prephenate dehydrogenase [Marivirga sp.]
MDRDKMKNIQSVGIIGLGLIGGSVAKDLKEKKPDLKLYGTDLSSGNAKVALNLKLVDEVLNFEKLFKLKLDVIIICVPVNAIIEILGEVLTHTPKDTIIIDTGSTKSAICKSVEHHAERQRFVAAHPIAGTENAGPEAAILNLFNSKVNIICEPEKSSLQALTIARTIFNLLGMKEVEMNAEMHDKHLAYVSHLSHISSFMLASTVLNVEKEEQDIFKLAGSGFASTTRLAKSSPEMWSPIFSQNKEYLTAALDDYIQQLQLFQQHLKSNNAEALTELMKKSNQIRKVLESLSSQIH